MVNQINNDSAGMKAMDLNGRMKTRNRDNKAPDSGQVNASSDNVNLSDASKKIDTIKASFKDMPEVDSGKVAHFKAEIAAGNYTVNTHAIAKKMMNAEPA